MADAALRTRALPSFMLRCPGRLEPKLPPSPKGELVPSVRASVQAEAKIAFEQSPAKQFGNHSSDQRPSARSPMCCDSAAKIAASSGAAISKTIRKISFYTIRRRALSATAMPNVASSRADAHNGFQASAASNNNLEIKTGTRTPEIICLDRLYIYFF